MRLRRYRRFDVPALTNPVERGQAAPLHIILLLTALLGVVFAASVSMVLVTGVADFRTIIPFLGLALLLIVNGLSALVLLRRGRFQLAVFFSGVGITVIHSAAVIAGRLASADLLLMYLLPITLAGMLSSRRTLPVVITIACAAVWIAAFLAPPQAIGAPRLDAPSPPFFIAFNFTLIAGLTGGFFTVFGNALQRALVGALAREQELQALRDGLEQTVQSRTADLQTALAEVEAQAADQARLRDEADAQRNLVRRMAVPVLPVSADTLVVPLVGSLDSQRLTDLQTEALTAIEHGVGRRLVLDITGVPMVDTQVAEGLLRVMQAVRLLGGTAILVGIRPEVAQAMVSLGVDLQHVPTYSTLQAALDGDRVTR